jgi:hypothetical protein
MTLSMFTEIAFGPKIPLQSLLGQNRSLLGDFDVIWAGLSLNAITAHLHRLVISNVNVEL